MWADVETRAVIVGIVRQSGPRPRRHAGGRPHPFSQADLEDVQRVAEFRAGLRRFLRVTEDAARRHGLTPRRYLLLLMIMGAPDGSQESTVSELAHRLQLAQSTVTELVQRAEDAGLIARQPSDRDGRVARLSLTKLGERRLLGLMRDLREERRTLRNILELLER